MSKIEKKFMPNPPMLDIKTNINHSPHVVILGAGASRAAFLKGERNGRKLPVMSDFFDVVGLNSVIARSGQRYNGENFESWYDELVSSNTDPKLQQELEDIIEVYFEFMQLPDHPTVYDYLILSLRKKDIIATFNWDPLLGQAFARNKNIIGFENMPEIVYLHGNTGIGICYECKSHGWRYNPCMQCGKTFSPSKLLFPIRDKNYNKDDFIFDQWKRLENQINRAYFFTIFGYSAPKTDVNARQIMLSAWQRNASENYTIMSIIDIDKGNEILKNWEDFIVGDDIMITNDFFDSYLARYPRRSCEAWAMATLQQDPWRENRFPRDVSLSQLQQWTLKLVAEEQSGQLSKSTKK